MTTVDFDILTDFMKTTQVIYAIGLIICSAGISLVTAIISSRRQKKTVIIEVFLERQLSAYQTYITNIFSVVKCARQDINTFKNIKNNEELRFMVIDQLVPAQVNALMFASSKLADLINECDGLLTKLLVANSNDEFVGSIEEISKTLDEIIMEIQCEIKSMKK